MGEYYWSTEILYQEVNIHDVWNTARPAKCFSVFFRDTTTLDPLCSFGSVKSSFQKAL